MYLKQAKPHSREDYAKKAACDWDYKKSWLPVVPKKGLKPLTKEELDVIQSECKYPFSYELIANGVVLCNNRHGGIALINKGYLPSFFVQD